MAEKERGAKVIFSGSPTEVMEAVGDTADAARRTGKKMAQDSNNGGEAPERPGIPLPKLLMEPTNTVRATRKTPTPGFQLPDPQQNNKLRRIVSQVAIETPTSIQEIIDEIDQNLGGKDWMIEIYDKDNQKIGGKKIRLTSAPKPVFEEDAQANFPQGAQFQNPWAGGMQPGFPQQGPMGFADPRLGFGPMYRGGDEDEEEDEEKLIKKEKARLEVEEMRRKAREDEEERKERAEQRAMMRGQGQDLKQMISGEISKLTETVRRIETEMGRFSTEFGHRLEGVERGVSDKFQQVHATFKEFQNDKKFEDSNAKHASETRMREVESAIEKAMGKIDATFSEIKSQVASNQGGGTAMTALSQMQNSFTTALTEMNKNVLNVAAQKSEQPDSFDRFVQAFGAIAQFTGMGNFQGPQDPTTAIINAATETVPKVLQFMADRQAAGQQVTEDMINEKIREVAGQVAPTIAETVKSTVASEFAKRAKKPGAPAHRPAPAPAPKTQAAQAPSPAPSGQPAARPAPVASVPAPVNVEEQTRLRVGGMLKTLLGEIDTMPGEAQWVEYALRYLPRKLMKQISEMQNPMEVGAMLARYAEPGIKDAVTAHLLDPEKQQWMGQQFTFLIEEFRAREAQAPSGVAPVSPSAPAAE